MVKTTTTAVLLLLLTFYHGAWGDEPTAVVDRTTVAMKESFNLIIEVPGSGTRNQPDFAVLETDFEMVRKPAKETEVTIINGESQATTRFFITLTPKRPGELQVPSLTIGNTTTKPIAIVVTEAAIVVDEDGAPDLFLEAEVSDPQPLIQSQVTYTMRLFHAVDIREGSLSEPELRHAVVIRLGDDVQYQVNRNQRRYQVVERRYAVFPERSGPMTLPPPVFSGQLPERRELSSLSDLFGKRGGSSGNPFGSFFHPTRPVRVAGPETQLEVMPAPAMESGQTWLPAAGVELTEAWTTKPLSFTVGEPTTRTLIVRGLGVTAAHLPEIKVKSSDSIKVYADRPSTRTLSEGDFVVGERKVKLAMVPTRPGPLTLPAVGIEWWDTTTGKVRRTVLPEREVAVLPSASPVDDSSPVIAGNPPTTDAGQVTQPGAWPFVVLGLLVAWVVTLVAWVRARGGKPEREATDSETSPEVSHNVKSLRRACQTNEARDAKEALIAWAGLRWGAANPQTLMAIATCVRSPDTTDALMELDRVLYNANESTWTNGGHLWSCLRAETGDREHSKTRKGSRLPPLYPE